MKQIRKVEQINRLHNVIMGNQTKGFIAQVLHFDANGFAETMLQQFAAITAARYIESKLEHDVWVPVTGDGCEKKVSHYARSVLVINAETSMNVYGLLYDFRKKGLRQMFRVIGTNGESDRFFIRNEDKVTDIVKGETISFSEMKEIAKNGLYLFDGDYDISSPGQLKKKVLVRFGKYYGPDKERRINWDKIMNLCTCGAWEVLNRSLKDKKDSLSFKEVANVAVRMALNAVVTTLNDTPLENFALCPGEFLRETVLGTKGEPFSFMDGTAPFSAEYLAACIQSKLGNGYKVHNSATEGLVIQCRPFWVCKGTAWGVSRDTLWNFFNDMRGGKEVVRLYRDTGKDEFGMDFEADWEQYCLSKGKGGRYANKVVVVLANSTTPIAAIDAVMDFNFVKTVWNLRDYSSGLNALSMAHNSHEDGVTSSQLLQTIFNYDFESGKEWYKSLAETDVKELFDKLNSSVGKAPHFEDFLPKQSVISSVNGMGEETADESVNIAMTMKGVAPHFARAYFAPEYRQSVKKGIEGITTRFNAFNVKMSGRVIHNIILPDPVAITTGYTILRNRNEKGVTETIGADFRNVSHEECVRRISELPVDSKKKELAIRAITNLAHGISYVPANQEAAMLGEGWDFDGDTWYIFVDLGIAIRYPKTHSEGYFRVSENCTLPEGLCVNKDC